MYSLSVYSGSAKGTQRTWEVEVSLAQTTLPPPSLLPLFQVRVFRQFLVFVFYAYCLQCVFICLLCAIPSILTIFDQLGRCFCVCWYVFDFYAATTLYFQISSLPLLLPFSCAAIITLMWGTISTMLTKANNAPRLESNAQKVPRSLSRWLRACARAAGWGKSCG